MHVWDVKSGRCLTSWTNRGPIFFVQFSPVRNCVFAASRAGELHVLRPDFRSEVQNIDIRKPVERWPVAISLEGKYQCTKIASLSDFETCITIWVVNNGQCLEMGQLEGHESELQRLHSLLMVVRSFQRQTIWQFYYGKSMRHNMAGMHTVSSRWTITRNAALLVASLVLACFPCYFRRMESGLPLAYGASFH